MADTVIARLEPLCLPTYPVGIPEKNPVFFERRVYQGSSGKVYPVPFVDKVSDGTIPVTYQSAVLENEYVRLVMLPEIGGRVLQAQDKSNGGFDFFYRQDVIKPALVGLAGPWISGGVEFNWPQHHRPGTFLPTDVFIEEEADGARTVWMSEHDPINRLKGMHGLRLRPGSSLIELRVRLFNRTPFTRTFLWWTNIAARVHDRYQSFFPPDVHYVADHAVRAQSSFPVANNPYYGVPYQDRPGANDLTWYRNIPVPTSYMVCESAFDFFGGYDHEAGGGFVHVADRHIAPGKKQWTWGNHAFGHAWDRELTDTGGPYIELMAGVYTDNQPDFSYLAPYEVRSFSQYWWPIQKTGPVQNASEMAAIRLTVDGDRRLDLGVLVSAPLSGARILVTEGDQTLLLAEETILPGKPFLNGELRMAGERPDNLLVRLLDAGGGEIIRYRPQADESSRRRPVAVEPPMPAATSSTDELFLTGEHLEQYRHPTRFPESYWLEALRRDPGDVRCHLALGKRFLESGRFAEASPHLEQAVARLTARHPNPMTGEAHYHLGLLRRWENRDDEASALLHKAAWNHEWRTPACYALATLETRRGNFSRALVHLEDSLDTNRRNNKARVLTAALLRRLGRAAEARRGLAALLAVDPLDHWARHEQELSPDGAREALPLSRNDAQTALDLAFDYADAGLWDEAITLLETHRANPVTPVAVPNPLQRSQSVGYVLAWLKAQSGSNADAVARELAAARGQRADWFFPSRLHEEAVLRWAIAQPGADPLANYALGNYCYNLRRHAEAVACWERAVAAGTRIATVHRNLGIAYWNVRRDGARASAAYEQAIALDPRDARLVYEYDQLRKKCNVAPAERLAFLESKRELTVRRDDASVELAALYNLSDRPADALEVLLNRRFHPWEGGEGAVLRQYACAHLRLGRLALDRGAAAEALGHFEQALEPPLNLGEVYHPLQAKVDAHYWLGRSLRALGREAEAVAAFEAGVRETGDFGRMAVTAHSPNSFYRGLSLRELGREEEARGLFNELRDYAAKSLGQPARIDYFATSLPNLLVFDEDLQLRDDAENHLLLALAAHGLNDRAGAKTALEKVIAITNSELIAADLARSLGVA